MSNQQKRCDPSDHNWRPVWGGGCSDDYDDDEVIFLECEDCGATRLPMATERFGLNSY